MNIRKIPLLLLLLLALVSCAKKTPVTPAPERVEAEMLQDIRDFPQNLEVYAARVGKDKPILSHVRQEELARNFINILFGPWDMGRTSIRKGDVSGMFSRARGYKDATRVWTQAEWDDMRRNAGLATYPNRNVSAITLRDTDLRELPTHEYRFSEPTPVVKDNPFDYFQYALLPIGTPLLVAHTSLDGRWHYVECPIAGGWVDARDVAFVDDSFKSLWRGSQYAALIKDQVNLPGTGQGGNDSRSGIGAVLPLAGNGTALNMKVLVPVKGRQTFADSAEIDLAPGTATAMPMPLTPGNVAKVGNVLMGQAYGWGGMLGLRDCSSMTRDLLTPFGIWLPRNSVAQARRGAVVSLYGQTASEKAATILREGVPFLSLVGMRGHITMYVGVWQGKPAIFHNAWGIRVIGNYSDDERFVIGKAVVTSITPGMELRNLYRPVTFVDRIRTLSTPGY